MGLTNETIRTLEQKVMLCIDVNSNYVGYRSFGTVTRRKKIEGNAVFPQSPVSLPFHSLVTAFIKNS